MTPQETVKQLSLSGEPIRTSDKFSDWLDTHGHQLIGATWPDQVDRTHNNIMAHCYNLYRDYKKLLQTPLPVCVGIVEKSEFYLSVIEAQGKIERMETIVSYDTKGIPYDDNLYQKACKGILDLRRHNDDNSFYMIKKEGWMVRVQNNVCGLWKHNHYHAECNTLGHLAFYNEMYNLEIKFL